MRRSLKSLPALATWLMEVALMHLLVLDGPVGQCFT